MRQDQQMQNTIHTSPLKSQIHSSIKSPLRSPLRQPYQNPPQPASERSPLRSPNQSLPIAQSILSHQNLTKIVNPNSSQNHFISSPQQQQPFVIHEPQSRKIISLTLSHLLDADQTKTYGAYQRMQFLYISVVARVDYKKGHHIKISDSTNKLDFTLIHDALIDAVELKAGKYFEFIFRWKRTKYQGYSKKNYVPQEEFKGDLQLFQIHTICKLASGNQITLHLAKCLEDNIDRENKRILIEEQEKDPVQQSKIKEYVHKVKMQRYKVDCPDDQLSSESTKTLKKKLKIRQQLTSWCKQVRQFDENRAIEEFKKRGFTDAKVKQLIAELLEECVIMDLGLIYQWVGEEQQW